MLKAAIRSTQTAPLAGHTHKRAKRLDPSPCSECWTGFPAKCISCGPGLVHAIPGDPAQLETHGAVSITYICSDCSDPAWDEAALYGV